MSLVLVHVGKRKRSLYWESKYVVYVGKGKGLSFGRISASRVIYLYSMWKIWSVFGR